MPPGSASDSAPLVRPPPPLHELRIIQHVLRVDHSARFKENHQVMIGMSQAEDGADGYVMVVHRLVAAARIVPHGKSVSPRPQRPPVPPKGATAPPAQSVAERVVTAHQR